MARKSKSKSRPDADQISGIPAAAIEGAEKADPSAHAGKLANPGPGLTDSPKVRPSAVSQSQEDLALEDEDQDWRRAGGGGPDSTEASQH